MEGRIKGNLFEGYCRSQLAPQGSNKGQGFIALQLMASESSRPALSPLSLFLSVARARALSVSVFLSVPFPPLSLLVTKSVWRGFFLRR